jgi:hypothetical protein
LAAVNAATARANKTAILFIFIAFSLLLVDPLTPGESCMAVRPHEPD